VPGTPGPPGGRPPPTQADRQALGRVLIKPIALTPVEGSPRQPQVQVLGHTPATTALWGPRPSKRDRLRTPPANVACAGSVCLSAPSPCDRLSRLRVL
jgi:hypothetical protein